MNRNFFDFSPVFTRWNASHITITSVERILKICTRLNIVFVHSPPPIGPEFFAIGPWNFSRALVCWEDLRSNIVSKLSSCITKISAQSWKFLEHFVHGIVYRYRDSFKSFVQYTNLKPISIWWTLYEQTRIVECFGRHHSSRHWRDTVSSDRKIYESVVASICMIWILNLEWHLTTFYFRSITAISPSCFAQKKITLYMLCI